jgi:hypothetical protein
MNNKKIMKNLKLINYLLLLSLLLNVTIIGTFAYNYFTLNNREIRRNAIRNNNQPMGMMRFFNEELNLSPEQQDEIGEIRFSYMENARKLQDSMIVLRSEIFNETFAEKPNQKFIIDKSNELGKMHAKLKIYSSNYMREMYENCDKTQQGKLKEMFLSMQNTEIEVNCRMNRGNNSNNRKHINTNR